jgi:hypothetical protein
MRSFEPSDERRKVTNLKFNQSVTESNNLELVAKSRRSFTAHLLKVQSAAAWNLCHLRPGVYHKYFKKHQLTYLTLEFRAKSDLQPFMESLQRVRLFSRRE